jgi:Putative zinc-finger
MNCSEARRSFSAMLDSMLDGDGRHGLDEHLADCESCATQFAAMRRTKWLMANVAPHPAPPEMVFRLQGAISQQLAARRHPRPERLLARWEAAFNAFLFATAAGMISAVLIFGLLIGVLVPVPLSSANDVPTKLYTPPEMTSAPFGLGIGTGNADALLVEAVIDPHGRVEDYRVLNSPGESGLSPEMKNALIFTQFRPATSFGLPTSGRVVISFSNINVGG